MAKLNTMFVLKSTPRFQHCVTKSQNWDMAHNSYDRMMKALKATLGYEPSQTDIADWIDTDPQRVHNWTKRGVSKDGALDLQRAKGVSATWVLNGMEPMISGTLVSQPQRIDGRMIMEAIRHAGFAAKTANNERLDLTRNEDADLVAQYLMHLLEDEGDDESGTDGADSTDFGKSREDDKRPETGTERRRSKRNAA